MFRMIPAAVAFAVTTAFAIPLSAQTHAQPQAPSTVPPPPSSASGQPPPPAAGAPSTPAPDAGVPATATQQPPTPSVADTEYGTEILLLERIQKVLDEAADGQTGSVKVERGTLDELRAEVTQVRLALKARSVRGS